MRFVETSDGKTHPVTALSEIRRECEIVEGESPIFSLVVEIGRREYLLWEGSSPRGLEEAAGRVLTALTDETRRIVRLRTKGVAG